MSLEELPVPDNGNKPLFETVNMLDPRLCVQDSIKYAVEKSGQQVTNHIQKASSATSNGCTFSVVVPSISTVISRKVFVRGTLYFKITAPATTAHSFAVAPGGLCVAPFAFHQMCSNITCTINNATFSYDCANVLNEVLRCVDHETLNELNNYTPTQLDSYFQYSDCSLFGTNLITDDGLVPPAITAANLNQNWYSLLDSPFRSDGSLEYGKYSRGSYQVRWGVTWNNQETPAAAMAQGTGVAGGNSVAYIAVDFIEPLVMSPFLLSEMKSGSSAGIYGVQAINFNFLFSGGNLARAIRMPKTGATVEFVGINADTSLDFQFLSPHPSVKLPSRNIVPYMQLQTFKTNVGQVLNNVIQTNTIQLSNIPDSVILCVRKVNRDFSDADSYLPITNVNINFNNTPGICSGLKPSQLYECSVQAGLNMSWLEFVGSRDITPGNPPLAGASSTAARNTILTCGSVVKLDFGRHINIIQDWFAPGSITQANFSVAITVSNTLGATPFGAGSNVEAVVIFVHSGMIVSSLGSTSSYVGLLTKENVLQASEKPVINKGEYDRQFGGSWFSSLKSGISKGLKYAKPVASMAKSALGQSNDPRARQAAAALGAMGAGYSAGSKMNGRIY